MLRHPPAKSTRAPLPGVFHAAPGRVSGLQRVGAPLGHPHALPRRPGAPLPPGPTGPGSLKERLKAGASGRSILAATTAAIATALISAFVGDSGSGGTKGLVPAPGAGDAAAGKFLKADGTFAVPPGSGGGGNPRGYLAGFITSRNAGAPTTKIDVSPGACRDDTNAFDIAWTALKTIDTGGTGALGLDIGTLAASLWYYPYAIAKPDGTVSALLSLSPSIANTFTITLANPAVVTQSNHGLQVGAPWIPTTTGALPSALTAGTTYYVKTVTDVNTFTVAATQGGTAISTASESQSGVHTGTSIPALPSGYSYKRRIGSVKTDGSSHFLAYLQYGDLFRWDVPVQDVSVSDSTTTAVTTTLSVPTGAVVFPILTFYQKPGATSTALASLLSDLAQTATAPSASVFTLNSPLATGEASDTPTSSVERVPTNTSAQIRRQKTTSGAADANIIVTNGWRDPRGEDA